MYALLAMAPLAVMLFGVSCRYYWIPEWLRERFSGILWPCHWAMGETIESRRWRVSSWVENQDAARVRTTSDMSTDSDSERDSDSSGQQLQQAEPKLMLNILPIVTQLMHNLYILSTFGLCSPYLAVMIVICNSSHIIMWKVMLGRFMTCRIEKGTEIERKQKNAYNTERAISQDAFFESNVHELMKKNKKSMGDVALIALSAQLTEAKGIFAICIWPILLSSSFFFIFVSLDIAGDRVSWAGGLWIPATLCVVPLAVVWVGMKLLMRKRASALSEMMGDPSFSAPRQSESHSIELNTVANVLHDQA
jgi:hypothetical protein